MIEQLFDWLPADEVQPPNGPDMYVDTSVSEEVMVRYNDGYEAVGYAVYVNGKFTRWNYDYEERTVTHWAYINI